jgi:acyl transferase domain-containing protein
MVDESDMDANAVAIIGMACRLPGAADVDAFWSLLASGETAIRAIDASMLREAGVDVELLSDPLYVPRASWIDDVDRFDAGFFGVAPKEAVELDPQQRLLLQCAYHAVESAGFAPRDLELPVGVYVGCKRNTYYYRNLAPGLDPLRSLDDLRVEAASDRSFAAARIAHALNLSGPALSLDSACSTALVAVHTACRALVSFECDMALAGAANITVPQRVGYRYLEGGTFSPDGTCRAFDASARGTVVGDGVGIVVLKRLADAMQAGDNILAIIRGSAVNNDGAMKVGFWAPGARGQSQVIIAAQQVAGVSAEDITYVEAHGMGTPLGDSVEVMALTDAFRVTTEACGYCALTSSKPNVGHLEAAGGIASLIKMTQALKAGLIPPTLGVTTPNPQIDWAGSPFYLNRELAQWRAGASGRRIGAVSSFGIGGTNAHVIVEQAPEVAERARTQRAQLWPFSAMSAEQCDEAVRRVCAYAEREQLDAGDVAFTLQTGRERFRARSFIVAPAGSQVSCVMSPEHAPDLAFLFPDDTSRYDGMLESFYRSSEIFREYLDGCFERMRAFSRSGALLTFAVEYAMARYWEALGIRANVLVGHGTGEFVAACLADVITLDEAIRLVGTATELSTSYLRSPRRPLIFGSTGCLFTCDAAQGGTGVQPKSTFTTLRNMGIGLLLEVGPGTSLSDLALQSGFSASEVISSAPHRGLAEEEVGVLTALGRLWQHGIEPDWNALHRGEARRRVSLPGYVFARNRYWRDPPGLAPKAASAVAETQNVPPAPVSVEHALTAIWCELLGLERLGRDEDLFALGAHSLMAARFAAQSRQALQIEIPFEAVFEHPTVARLAAFIEKQRIRKPAFGAAPIARRDGDANSVSFAQERLWLVDRLEGSSGLYNEGFALLIDGPLQVSALEQALTALADRHETLRSAFPSRDGRPILNVLGGLRFDLQPVDLAAEGGRESRVQSALSLLSNESQRPFDLATGPLLRCVLLRLEAERHVLGLFVHHIVADGLSTAILCRDLAELYEASCRNRAPRLAPLPVQYADYAAWQRCRLTAECIAPHLAYWREKLLGATAVNLAEIDGDRDAPKGAVHRFSIERSLIDSVNRTARQLRTTPFVLMLGSFQLLLAARSGSRDIVVTTPVTERQHNELQDLIGLFVGSLVLRQKIPQPGSVAEYFADVHANHKAALAHQLAPFEQIVDAVGRERGDRAGVSRMLSQARFVYLNELVEKLSFEQLVATPLPVSRRLAKFEILLTLQSGAQQCRADIEYRTAIFTPASIAHFAEAFVRLLRRVTFRPEMRVASLLDELNAEYTEWQLERRHEQRLERRRGLEGLRRKAVAE